MRKCCYALTTFSQISSEVCWIQTQNVVKFWRNFVNFHTVFHLHTVSNGSFSVIRSFRNVLISEYTISMGYQYPERIWYPVDFRYPYTDRTPYFVPRLHVARRPALPRRRARGARPRGPRRRRRGCRRRRRRGRAARLWGHTQEWNTKMNCVMNNLVSISISNNLSWWSESSENARAMIATKCRFWM